MGYNMAVLEIIDFYLFELERKLISNFDHSKKRIQKIFYNKK